MTFTVNSGHKAQARPSEPHWEVLDRGTESRQAEETAFEASINNPQNTAYSCVTDWSLLCYKLSFGVVGRHYLARQDTNWQQTRLFSARHHFAHRTNVISLFISIVLSRYERLLAGCCTWMFTRQASSSVSVLPICIHLVGFLFTMICHKIVSNCHLHTLWADTRMFFIECNVFFRYQ